MEKKRIFVGRDKELVKLHSLLEKRVSSLVVIKGRRRIGKSRLVNEFAKEYSFLKFSGLSPAKETTAQSQRDEFSIQLSAEAGVPEVTADDWSKIFILLAKYVSSGRHIVFFDEISWMGDKDPSFLGKLKNAWDSYFSKNPELILILCGSASAWVEKNILSSTGFLGRVSMELTLQELPMPDCSKLLSDLGSNLSNHDKLKLLCITGGVPRYIEEVYPNLEAEENIRRLCFNESGILFNEFPNIFSDLFSSRSALYEKIVRSLIGSGANFTEICERVGLKKSGHISEYLKDLLSSGFIAQDYAWNIKSGKISRISRYRLKDNYSRFYLKYIAPNKTKIELSYFEERSMSSLPGLRSILGLQFENLVLNNRRFIHNRLGLKSEDIVIDNPYLQKATAAHRGCQVDYLIQTRFNNLFACEIKFTSKEISSQIIQEVRDKIDKLVVPRGFSVFPVLIHVNGVSDGVMDSEFFTKIIDFSEVLEIRQ